MVALIDRNYVHTAPGALAPRLFSYAMVEGRPVTTRGRWINPAARLHLRLAGVLARRSIMVPPIYIAGLGRSGTTALGRILSTHPDIGYLNEPKLAWNVIHPGEDVIGNYSREDAKYVLRRRDATPGVIERAERIFSHYLRSVRRSCLVDKYPEMIFRTEFARTIFPGARFLCLIRSPSDTIASITEWSKRFRVDQLGEQHDWWGVDDRKWKLFSRDVLLPDPCFASVHHLLGRMDRHGDRAALEWAATTRASLRARLDYPKDTLLVRYESWTTWPREETVRILNWAGLRLDVNTIDYAAATTHPSKPRKRADLHPRVRALVMNALDCLEEQENWSCE